MATITLNPNSTVTLGGATVINDFGAPTTAHVALSDNIDTTYVDLAGIHTGLGFPAPSIPAGANVTAVVAYVRVAVDTSLGGGGGSPVPATLRTTVPDIAGSNSDIVVTNVGPMTTLGLISIDMEANGAVTDWEVDLANRSPAGGGGQPHLYVYKLYQGVTYVPKPVVTVSNPTGTISNTSFPLAVWDWVEDLDGGSVNRAEVKIFNDAQYGASGFTPGGSTAFAGSGILDNESGGSVHQWRSTTKLPNDTYRAYVRVRQFDKGPWSNWAFHGFVVNVVAPADPSSITVTPEESQGRMLIDVVGSDTPRSVDAVDIQRSEDAGTSWTPIRPFGQTDEGVGITPVSAEVVAWDWEAPIGREVIYRARTLHAYSLGEWASSDWVESSPATLNTNTWWLKHPTNWTLDSAVFVRSQASSTRAARQGIFTPLGRSDPVVVSDARLAPAGDIVFRTMDESDDGELAAIEALVDTDVPVLIQAPPDNAWPDRWVTLGDMTYERVVDGFSKPWLFLNFTWQEVVRPEGTLEFLPAGGPTHLTLPFDIGDTLS